MGPSGLLIWMKKNLQKEARIERERFYPGPGFEPGPLALFARVLITKPSRTSTEP